MTRPMIATDLSFDPTNREKLRIAKYVIAVLINQLRKNHGLRGEAMTDERTAEYCERIAKEQGILPLPDDLHHAPMCPANLWHGQMLPTAPCSCGAVRR